MKKNRRNILKQAIVAGSAVGTIKSLPSEWKKPAVASIALPAHAQMSATLGSVDNCVSLRASVSGSFTNEFQISGTNLSDSGQPAFSGAFNGYTFSGSYTVPGGVTCVASGSTAETRQSLSGSVNGTNVTSTHMFNVYCDDIQVYNCGTYFGTGSIVGTTLFITATYTCVLCEDLTT